MTMYAKVTRTYRDGSDDFVLLDGEVDAEEIQTAVGALLRNAEPVETYEITIEVMP